jgi:hypothetical protein
MYGHLQVQNILKWKNRRKTYAWSGCMQRKLVTNTHTLKLLVDGKNNIRQISISIIRLFRMHIYASVYDGIGSYISLFI